jgi:hypothetical protein
MALPQKSFGLLKLISAGLRRTKRPIEEFKPYSIKVINYYPSSRVIYGFEKSFAPANECPSFVFNAAFPIVAQCILQSTIPSSLMGLIHIDSRFNTFTSHNWFLPCDIEVVIASAKSSDQGIRYKVETKVYQFQKLTITNTNTFLDKNRSYKSANKNNENNVTLAESPLLKYGVKLRDAFRYAYISNDFNPIHLNHWLAKKFGMQHALVHGMYNVHRCIDFLLSENLIESDDITIEFNKPCFLPASVALFQYQTSGNDSSETSGESTETSNVGDEDSYGLYNTSKTKRFVNIKAIKKEA